MNQFARRYAERSVPRYTSYPTAADFTAMIGADDHVAWLAAFDRRDAVSVYLHVPYCREICSYCGCNTKMALRDEVISRYRRALEAEIGLVACQIKETPSIARLHWGGGTPSILGVNGLRSVLAVLGRHFALDPAGEHAIELDPRYVTTEFAEGIAALGVTRASLGVQDVNPQVQAAIGRIQPLTTVELAARRLRSAGIGNLNFDLIYGLPLQTPDSIRETCDLVSAMRPDRIACFGYAHLPRLKANQRRIDETTLPSLDQRIVQAELIAVELVRRGYVRIGIDHFAIPSDPLVAATASGKLHRNFQGYTDDGQTALLGFGASSISTFPSAFVQNISDVPKYVHAIESGRLASTRGCRLDADDRLRGKIIERLMCDFSANLAVIAPDSDFSAELSTLAPMIEDGLVELDGDELIVTEAGRPIVRVVAAAFDSFRRSQTAQFSRAI